MKSLKYIIVIFLIGLSVFSCINKFNTYSMLYILTNKTKYTITINEKKEIIKILPFSKYEFVTDVIGSLEPTKDKLYPFPLESIFCKKCVVVYDNIKCDTLNGAGPQNIVNYEFIKVQKDKFELTYSFDEDDFNFAKKCN